MYLIQGKSKGTLGMSVNVKKRLGLKIRQRFLGSSLAKSGGKEAFGLRVVGAGNEEDSHCTL